MTAVIVNAKPLVGTMDLTYNLLWEGPGLIVPTWEGTITIDGYEYDMYFYATTWGKDVGKVHFFEEVWLIKDDDNVLLTGTDTGVLHFANSKGRMNGVVTDANEEYAHLIGHNVTMSGTVNWAETPPCLMGFRVN